MSDPRVLEMLVVPVDGEAGALTVASPRVGVYSESPRVGEVLVGGSSSGRLTSLGVAYDLVLPSGFSGRVTERTLRHRAEAVEYGQVVLRLAPVEAIEDSARGAAGAGALHDVPEGCFAVTSPTHGMFYRRPRPDEPVYVDPGQVVDEGATLGLVEVMKCFSAIAYRGEDFPPRAEVVEIRADDGTEVQSEQVLFVMKPA